MTRPVRVLVVDDSALMRQLLSEILAADPRLEVVGTAADPYAAWTRIQQLHPDVLTLDIEMPRMDGLTFLEKLMRMRPMPVVMVSSLTERGAEATFRALELGAVDFLTKPKLDLATGTAAMAEAIRDKVRAAAGARLRIRTAAPPPRAPAAPRAPAVAERVLAIGASTGGTEALRDILTALPADAPPVVVVQHMPEKFTSMFAVRLNGLCRVEVKEAEDFDALQRGRVLIAPGDRHMEMVRSGGRLLVRLHSGEPVNRHRPSVDVLFESCARVLGSSAVGAILTGMGADGARGLLAMRSAGARTLAQNEATCVVFGMPKEAIAIGAAAEVHPLDRIAEALLRLAAE